MRHVYIINPAAGKTDRSEELCDRVGALMEREGLEYACHLTSGPGDATRLARGEAERGDEVRLYACGGDGTLNEVLAGIAGFPNAALSQIPIGSGNDFIKLFGGGVTEFTPEGLLDARESEIDLIECNGRYAINICSVGLDARIGLGMVDFKRWPLVSGKGAYLLSLIANFIKGIHRPYEVEVDGQRFSGDMTLLCACNGRWYGGSFNPAPEAAPDDGLLEFRVVKAVSRLKAASVVGCYAKGGCRDWPEIIICLQGKEMRVRCQKEERINLDGEELRAQEVYFRVAEKRLRFFYPRNVVFS